MQLFRLSQRIQKLHNNTWRGGLAMKKGKSRALKIIGIIVAMFIFLNITDNDIVI